MMEQPEPGLRAGKDRLTKRLRERAALAQAGAAAGGASGGAAGAAVLPRLRPRDRIHQDNETIAAIYRNLGTAAAEQLVSRALAELSLQMAGLTMRLRSQQMAEMPRQLRKAQGMAESLGMITMAQVARDAQICLEAGETAAFAAVWARLQRIAERSLTPGTGLNLPRG